MSHLIATRNGQRFRRARRRGRLIPADAQKLSTRSRRDEPVTKQITRFHRQEWYWGDDKWSEQ